MDFRHDIEMSISHSDFFRLLPKALRNISYSIEQNKILVDYQEGDISIELGEEYQRKIASLVLPVTDIKLYFSGISKEQIESFLFQFNQAFRRGGG